MLNYLLITDTKKKTGYELAFGSVFFIFQTKENMLFLNPLIDKSHKQLTSVLKPGAIKTLDEIEMYLRQNFLLRAPRGFISPFSQANKL